jgi:hypothetical protein
MFSAGLNRIGEAAKRVWAGESEKAVAHATQGPVRQQNIVTTVAAKKGSN